MNGRLSSVARSRCPPEKLNGDPFRPQTAVPDPVNFWIWIKSTNDHRSDAPLNQAVTARCFSNATFSTRLQSGS